MILMFIITCLCIKNSFARPKLRFYELMDAEGNDSSLSTNSENKNSSCEQFLTNSTFNRYDVVGINWKVWYYWNHQYEDDYIVRFNLTTPEIIEEFKVALSTQKIRPPINWSDAVLYMKSSIDFSAIFVKTDVDGLFRVIHYNDATSMQSEMLFALKVVVPRSYLAIMNCKYQLCYALAPIDEFPDYEKCDEEAKKAGFYGQGHCHMTRPLRPPQETPNVEDQRNLDASENDVIMKILNRLGPRVGCNCNPQTV